MDELANSEPVGQHARRSASATDSSCSRRPPMRGVRFPGRIVDQRATEYAGVERATRSLPRFELPRF